MKGGGNNNKKCLSCMNVKIQEKKIKNILFSFVFERDDVV